MGQAASQSAVPPSASGCPIYHEKASTPPPAQCPVSHDAPPPAQCPVPHSPTLNPSNQIPPLPQSPLSPTQSTPLPTSRTTSSIPRERGEHWEYPSPQQFYNALVRKGWETPEEHVEMMVQIHNFLNERAWEEVRWWERRRRGDEDVQLTRFKGRPGELSPKARFWLFAGWLLPSRFNSDPPFDRHDWIIRRPSTNEEIRYVIDYYSAPPEPDGSPVFSLDVRPALDSLGSLRERMWVATEGVWGGLREREREREEEREGRMGP